MSLTVSVHRDDAAERRQRVALVRLAVRLGDVLTDRDAARVGVLDDRAGRLVAVVVRRAVGRVRVEEVVVGHLLAAEQLALGQAGDRLEPVGVERRRLVRVLAVPQDVRAVPGRAGPGREAGAVGGVGQHAAHPRRHVNVVRRGVDERLRGQRLALGEGEALTLRGGQRGGVVGGVGDDGDRGVVLRGRAHHRRAADVDLLDAVLDPGAGGDRVRERVEVHDDELERLHPQLVQLRDVVGQAAVGEDAGVHPRVQRLHPAVEALREAGELLDLRHREAQRLDQGGRTAGGDQRHAGLVQAADEVLEAGLVVDGHQGPLEGDPVVHELTPVVCR